jgi:hypothetical protein
MIIFLSLWNLGTENLTFSFRKRFSGGALCGAMEVDTTARSPLRSTPRPTALGSGYCIYDIASPSESESTSNPNFPEDARL